MTGLDTRPVRRETRSIDTTRSGRRPLVVMLEVGGKILRIRPRGTRTWYTVTYEDIYRLATRNRMQEIQRERVARRKGKRA